MSTIPEHQRGYQDALRLAVDWLHRRARSMTDPHAQAVLNSAATNLGWEIKEIVSRRARVSDEHAPREDREAG